MHTICRAALDLLKELSKKGHKVFIECYMHAEFTISWVASEY